MIYVQYLIIFSLSFPQVKNKLYHRGKYVFILDLGAVAHRHLAFILLEVVPNSLS
jgi:hypothetical protein